MDYVILTAGILSFIFSFTIHHYYIQFIVFGVLLTMYFIFRIHSKEIRDLKKSIEEHNKLVQEDIKILRKGKS